MRIEANQFHLAFVQIIKLIQFDRFPELGLKSKIPIHWRRKDIKTRKYGI